MLAAIINKTPEEWLREIGEPPDKIAEVLNSFQKGAALRVGYYRPDHLFVRFHGAKASKKPRILHGATVDNRIYLPNYWMDGTALSAAFARASQFEGWATDAIISKIARNYYREIAAIAITGTIWRRMNSGKSSCGEANSLLDWRGRLRRSRPSPPLRRNLPWRRYS